MDKNESLAWGSNNYGQLGYPSYNDNFVQLSNIDDVIESAGGSQHSLVLKEDGTVWAWGRNNYGQLGDGTNTDSNEPVQVKGLTDVIDIAAGNYHSLALKSDGTAWAWGNNNSGQLGDGTNTSSNQPVQVSTITGLSSVIGISGGGYHNLAIKSDGTTWAWGFNYTGQLGDGTNTNSNQPVQVSTITGLTNVIDISGGGYHSLAIKSDGTAWAWGANYYGQLGDGTNINSNQPVQVKNLTNLKDLTSFKKLSAGEYHSLAIKRDRTSWAWGSNSSGQLGDGTYIDSNEPIQVSTIINSIAIAAGYNHSLTLKLVEEEATRGISFW